MAAKTKRKAPRKKQAPASRGLSPADVGGQIPEDGAALGKLIEEDGGKPLAIYREPIGGHTVVLAALPIDLVEPTPYQRDRSEPHVKKLASAMERVDRFLDPLIAVRQDGKYWSPNGNHRLGAAKLLGQKAIVALVMPEPDIALQILAMNTEKAHNLKERSLEVIRMYRSMLGNKTGKESEYEGIFEEPSFATLGICYEQRPRYSAGAYSSMVKKLEGFLDEPLKDALKERERRATRLLELDDEVGRITEGLKAKGLVSPYLKNFVVARLNYLRFVKGDMPPFDAALDKMLGSAKKFDVEKVKREDIARAAGPAEESE